MNKFVHWRLLFMLFCFSFFSFFFFITFTNINNKENNDCATQLWYKLCYLLYSLFIFIFYFYAFLICCANTRCCGAHPVILHVVASCLIIHRASQPHPITGMILIQMIALWRVSSRIMSTIQRQTIPYWIR